MSEGRCGTQPLESVSSEAVISGRHSHWIKRFDPLVWTLLAPPILRPPQTWPTSLCCQRCGAGLEEVRVCRSLWLAFLNCNACSQAYLQVADARWVSPLQFSELSVLQKAVSASDEALAAAAASIRFIDYKTVSIVAFEKTLFSLWLYDLAQIFDSHSCRWVNHSRNICT